MSLLAVKIAADSSADTLVLEGVPFACAPLKIITADREYVDDAALDVERMTADLKLYSGKSGTSCPGVGDWLTAFGDAQDVFCVTITSGLSGSYNAACMAKQAYEEKHPGRRVFVIDSLSAGPELRLIIEKLREYILAGDPYEEICRKIMEYRETTGLIFMLESMRNLANNGRVSPLTAKAAGLLGIRALGKASEQGTLEMLDKRRGEDRALGMIVGHMWDQGVRGGKVRISHCGNLHAANRLKAFVQARFPEAEVEVYRSRGLCSFYAEKGGLLIGFEREKK